MDGASFVQHLLVPGGMQEEANQLIDTVVQLIDKTDVFAEEDKEDAMLLVVNFLDAERRTIGPDTDVSQMPSVFMQLAKFLKLENQRYGKAFVKKLYQTEKGKVSPQEYQRWKLSFLNQFLPEGMRGAHLQPGTFSPIEAAKDLQRLALPNAARWVMQGVLKLNENVVKYELTSGLEEALQALSGWGQFIATAAAFVGYMGIVGIYNLWMYKRHGRSWERVKKSFIDNGVTFGVQAIVGYGVVAILGCIFGPLGAWAAFSIGALAGLPAAMKARQVIGKWTSERYNIPSDEDLENDYKLLEVKQGASQQEVVQACRRLSAPFHPDNVARQPVAPSRSEIEHAIDKFTAYHNAKGRILAQREIEMADEGIDQGLDWKDQFVLFFKNLVSIRKVKNRNPRDDVLAAIEFDDGIPPLDVYADGSATVLEAPLTPVGVQVRQQCVQGIQARIIGGNTYHVV